MKQEWLFPSETKAGIGIPGLRLEPDYITGREELELLHQAGSGVWRHDFRRRIQVYGLGYSDAKPKSSTWVRDFPNWLIPLAQRVGRDARFERAPENCVVNEYTPGQGIGPHSDYPEFGPIVACVSLGSDIVMNFAEPRGGLRVPVFVPARSLWVISGEARWRWTHGIAPRLSDSIEGLPVRRGRRVSITFRTGTDPDMTPAAHHAGFQAQQAASY